MPVALITLDESADAETVLDAETTTSFLHAGALDIAHSPLSHEDTNRLVGHVKESARPPARLVGAPMAQNLVDSIRNTCEPELAFHRPDKSLPPERKAAVESAFRKWHFPAQDFDADELTYGALIMLEHILSNPELKDYGLARPQLITFLLATRRQYKHEREVHYHNWRHAVDVTQSLYCFLLDVRICPPMEGEQREHRELNAVERILTPLDGLILLVSAIGHDVGHPGVNNAFLVACNHPLAQTYNDKSVLENYHCAAYSQLLRRHWPSLHSIAGFRATLISNILATDMQRHFEYMSSLGELKAKVKSSEISVDSWTDKDREHTRELIMALLMKAADISNVARPFDVSARWAKILMNEFSRQGELEGELQIPTCLFGGPPNKEDVLAAAQSQKGFMSLFGFPLFQGLNEIMPSVSCSIRELENNRNVWDQKIEEEKRKRAPGSTDIAPLTLSSVTDDDIDKAAAYHKPEPGAVPIQPAQIPSSPTKRTAVTGLETSPSKHAGHDLRQHLAKGLPTDDDRRSSSPFLGSPGVPLSSPGGSSRRSSKDVALDQLQHLSGVSNQSLSNPGSRRGSADAGWHIHQSYPGSRRGSKDESLTTIVVTSGGGTPNRRSSPSSPGKKSSPSKPASKWQGLSQSQKPSAARTSVPSSRSHATSTATATTTLPSPSTESSTQPSSPDDEPTLPVPHPSIPSTEDPFMSPGSWPNDADGNNRASPTQGLPHTTPSPPPLGKGESPHIVARMASGETADTRSTPRKSESGLRESRSRSRLRGLKFWKKKRDASGVDTASADSAPSSP